MMRNMLRNHVFCLFTRFGTALILLAGLFAGIPAGQVHALATTITVPDDYSTIQATVNAASAGDTVSVRNGVYHEHVTINKAITLTGQNRPGTIVDGGGSGKGLYVTVNGVTISHLTVRRAAQGIHLYQSSGSRIEDVQSTGHSDSGFNLGDRGSSGNTFQNVTAFANTTSGIVGYAGSGNITVSDSALHHNTAAGITIGWSPNWVITNTALHANGVGLYLDTASAATIRNCDFYANTQEARFTGFVADGHLFEGNRFHHNTSVGLSFNNDAHNNTIRANDFYNNPLGVDIRDATNRQSYNNVFYQNIFTNNTVHAQAAATGYSNTWDSGYPGGGNYWGDYAGVDANNGASQNLPGRDGIGDSAYVITAATNIDRYPLMGLYATNNGPTPVGNSTALAVSTLLGRTFTYTWDFGDGTLGSGATPAHTYPSAGVYTATVTASDQAVIISATTEIRVLSNNASLSNLVLSTGALTPLFAAGITSYTQNVAHAVTNLTVTTTVADANATVTVNGTPVPSGSASGSIILTVGNNSITVVVTAEDAITTKTYTITVTRAASPNANLSSLVLSTGALTPAFTPSTTSYTQMVDNNVTSLTVTPMVVESNATVMVNGTQVASGSASSAINLVVGDNIINTVVTAPDGSTTKTYMVTVTRAADTTPPTVDSFSAPSSSSNLTILITTFTASDGNGVTGYRITTSNAAPAADAPEWAGTAPTTYTVAEDGTYTLYPWAKDAAGNVSAVFESPVTVTVKTDYPIYLPVVVR